MKITRILIAITIFSVCNTLTAQQSKDFLKKNDTIFLSSSKTKIFAEVGSLKVPENRKDKNSRWITINYVRLKSTSTTPKAPLIYLEGGGSASTHKVLDPYYLDDWIPYLAISDVILFDQRGTTDQDVLWISNIPYPENFLVTQEAAGDHWKAMGKKALHDFEKRGVDVTGYTVYESAKDIEALRIALKIDKISIVGFSFGTHLGLALIKLYEDSIASAVLAGVDGLDESFNYPGLLDMHFKKIDKLFQDHMESSAKLPNLYTLLERAMWQLENEPMNVTVLHPLSREPMTIKVGPFGLSLIIRLDIDDTSDIPIIPRLLYTISKRDTSVLQWFVQKRIAYAFAIPGNGLTQGIASGVSTRRWRKIDREEDRSIFKNVVNFPFYDIKEIWPTVSLEVDTRKKDKNDIRTLLLSGDLDCRTPPSQAEALYDKFNNIQAHIVVKNAGHEQILTNEEVKRTILSFLSGNEVSKSFPSNDEIVFIPFTGKSEKVSHPSIEE